ncbi:hypothetical protein SS50377_26835 [Spironucleus salmonicida]|uniref:Uncharacterized protein n=1 Tax=Spironucleus salmonicida TaxID=348837 RepID=V6LYH9_9EUKA|nr:hypothetical protein SS50377_26835 [Spironucleus salmonicida]|eukprot:EST49303.1 Hypothetical protein SS50377_10527 [Spironucleus salmonicida]
MEFNILETISQLSNSSKLNQTEQSAIIYLCDQFFAAKKQNSQLITDLSNLQSQFLSQKINIQQNQMCNNQNITQTTEIQPKYFQKSPLPSHSSLSNGPIASPQFDFAPITQKFTFDPDEYEQNAPLTASQIKKYQNFNENDFLELAENAENFKKIAIRAEEENQFLNQEKLQILQENAENSMIASQQMERAAVAEAEIRKLKDQLLLAESDGLRSQLREVSREGINNLEFLEDIIFD